jgi:radical SAM superfamily enzyme YgiQ (UPF0313 family)
LFEVDLLLVQPWIYDFSAHDFWLKPYGLLKLGGLLRKRGYTLGFVDLLDPFHPELPKRPKRKPFGTGFFYKEPIPKPNPFLDVPRRYFRYGLPYPLAKKELSKYKPKAILTSITMTYWYPGLFALLKLLQEVFGEMPVFVGGIYVRLLKEHLQAFLEKEGFFHVFPVECKEYEEAVQLIEERIEPSGHPHPFDYPIFDLQREIPYVVLMTSEGCPYRCPYCASYKLYGGFKAYPVERILEEIIFWHREYKVVDFAFYDDALLYDFKKHLKPLLEAIIDLGLKVKFHTPNAIHARFIDEEVAKLLKLSGFTTLRLGLERMEKRFDAKVSIDEFISAIHCLRKAGFREDNLGAYVIFGIPHEDYDEVEKTLHFLFELRVKPYIAEFSPVPGTPFFKLCQEVSRYPIDEDPIFHNKSIFSAMKKPDWERIQTIKNLAREMRRRLTSTS